MKLLVFVAISTVVVSCFLLETASSPMPHHHYDDEYRPWIRALKALRRRERYEQYAREQASSSSSTRPTTDDGSGNPTDSSSVTDPVSTDFLGQRPQSSNSNSNGNSNSFSTPEQIQKIIREAQSNGNNPSGSGSRYTPVTSSPQRIEQINRGVSTILNGVGSASLEQILRGSFMFTRNDNVRSVANNVLDSIFGFGRQPSNNNN